MNKTFESKRTIFINGSVTFIIKRDADHEIMEISTQVNELVIEDSLKEEETSEDK